MPPMTGILRSVTVRGAASGPPRSGRRLPGRLGEEAFIAGAEEDLVQDFADLPIVVDDQDLSLTPCQDLPSDADGVATTWFLPARFAAYSAPSAARNRSSAVEASSSGRLATPKLAVTHFPCE